MDGKGVLFERQELYLLESALTPSGLFEEHGPDKVLMLKIASALLPALDGQALPIALSEAECWVLRERISLFAMMPGKADVGLSVKRKLYERLLAYANEAVLGPTVVIAEVEEHKPSAEEVAHAIRRGRRSYKGTRKN